MTDNYRLVDHIGDYLSDKESDKTLGNLLQFNRQDRRFAINLEYILEASGTNPSNDLVIRSLSNNIHIIADNSQSNYINLHNTTRVNTLEAYDLSLVYGIHLNNATFWDESDNSGTYGEVLTRGVSGVIWVPRYGINLPFFKNVSFGVAELSNIFVHYDSSFNNNVEISNHLLVKDASFTNKVTFEHLTILGDGRNLTISGEDIVNFIVTQSVSAEILKRLSSLESSYNIIDGAITICNDDVSFNNNVEISNQLIVNGDTSLNGNVEISNGLYLNGYTQIYINDTSGQEGQFLSISNNELLWQDISTISTKANLTNYSDASLGAVDISNLIVSLDASFNQNVEISGTLYLNQDTQISLTTGGVGGDNQVLSIQSGKLAWQNIIEILTSTGYSSLTIDNHTNATSTATKTAQIIGTGIFYQNGTQLRVQYKSSSSNFQDVLIGTFDTTSPVITILGNNPETVGKGNTYIDAGVTAIDSRDGDVTSQIQTTNTVDTTTLGSYYITYTVSDTAGNIASAIRTVIVVDTTTPILVLNGDASMTIYLYSTYVEEGAKLIDYTVDGISYELSNFVSPDLDLVDTSTASVYTLTYNGSDGTNQAQTIQRTIVVIDNIPPTLVLTGDASVSINQGDAYNEQGARIIDSGVDIEAATPSGTVDVNTP